MTGCIFLVTLGGGVFCRLQLDYHAGETLRQGVVDITGHAIAFIQDRREPALLG
jgi:hypothetical protein